MSILDELAAHARERVAAAKARRSPEDLAAQAEARPRGSFPFEQALHREGLSFICECKKASPSRGIIAEDFPCLEIAHDYEAAGADAISVLTEPKWFLGSDAFLAEIAQAVSLPCLRKDFVVDSYMIDEAKCLGAAAVLLIVSILDDAQLAAYIARAEALGLSALVEVHDENEIRRALAAGARIVGVNNRNLRDFSVDMDNSHRLRELVPPEVIFVAESGVQRAADVQQLEAAGADAVLIGTTLMQATDKAQVLRELRGQA